MKKVLSFLIVALLVFSSLLFVSKPASVASAEGMNYTQFLNYQNKVLNEYRQLKNRQAGTDGEKNAANFIKAELDKICKENQNLIPVNSSSVEDGVQKFTFTSKMTNEWFTICFVNVNGKTYKCRHGYDNIYYADECIKIRKNKTYI